MYNSTKCKQNIFPASLVIQIYKMILGGGILFLVGCWLPLDEQKPACFPNEACPLNFRCEAGKCVDPVEQTLQIQFSCLLNEGCFDSLRASSLMSLPSSGGTNEEELEIEGSQSSDLSSPQFCLILEQSTLLQGLPLNGDLDSTEPQRVKVSLFEGNLRTRLVVLNPSSSCPQGAQEVQESQLHQDCTPQQGCILVARTSNQSVQLSSEPLLIDFSQDSVCIESTWSSPSPDEVCDEQDNDCDGFIDEGVNCETP